MLNLSSHQFRRAAEIKEQIEALENELEQITGYALPGIPAAVVPTAGPKKRGRPRKEVSAVVVQDQVEAPKTGKRGPKKGGMSAAGRAKIAAAQQARWAKFNAAKASTSPKAAKAPKTRKMSAAGRAAISAAQKARWAAKRA